MRCWAPDESARRCGSTRIGSLTRRARNVDNYLREAAPAARPQSGIVYDPDGTGKRLAKLRRARALE